jgi:hypothetical protein
MTANKPPASDQDLQLTLRLDVRLSRGGPASSWSGEVSTPGGSERLCFLTLPSLIAWIARLEPCPAQGGLR